MSKLICRFCGADDSFSSIERITGYAKINSIESDPDPALKPEIDYEGWTEIDWDSSTTVGWCCENCNTEKDSLSELVKEPV